MTDVPQETIDDLNTNADQLTADAQALVDRAETVVEEAVQLATESLTMQTNVAAQNALLDSIDTTPPDVTPPIINVVATPTVDTITVAVTSNEPATIKATAADNGTVLFEDNNLNLAWSFAITGLDPATQYAFEVAVTDDQGNEVIETDVATTLPLPGGGTEAAQASHGQTTWYLGAPRPTGRYILGDPYFVGPVSLSAVTPTTVPGVRDGSQLDPPGGVNAQGYGANSKISYDSALNIAASLPATITEGTVVSSVYPSGSGYGGRPALETAACMTVVTSEPAARSFRPGYVAGAPKVSRHTMDDVDWSRLPSLELPSGAKSLSGATDRVARVWLDHGSGWRCEYIHPQENMGDHYGRNFTANYGDCLLVACDPTVSQADKEQLVAGLIQVGLDWFECAKHTQSPHAWRADGGHMSGRLFPILFAGWLFDDAEMLAVRDLPNDFGEINQTWRVEQSDVGRPLNPDSRSVKTLYSQSDVGKPEWGIRHQHEPDRDNATIDTKYRLCCTANAWLAQTLVSHAMGINSFWQKQDYFDYMDRYCDPSGDIRPHVAGWENAYHGWHLDSWDMHRTSF